MINIDEKVVETQRIYEGKVINLRIDTIVLPNGKQSKREIIEHSAAIVAVPILPDGRVVLVRQFRLPARGPLLEAPAGGVEPDEDIDEAVVRELEEEIGYHAGKVQKLFGMFVAPGYTEEIIYAYLATELTPQTAKADDDEFIQIETYTLDEALSKIDTGEIRDGKTIASLLYVKRMGLPIH